MNTYQYRVVCGHDEHAGDAFEVKRAPGNGVEFAQKKADALKAHASAHPDCAEHAIVACVGVRS